MCLVLELEFCAFLTYTPRPETEVQKKSKNLMYSLKTDDKVGNPSEEFSKLVAKKLQSRLSDFPFNNWFSKNTALVPVPKSSKRSPGALWVPSRLVDELVAQGLGYRFDCLTRIESVVKSATASSVLRPKAKKHFETISCKKILEHPKHILLIDDVVTRGATLLGCASRIKKTYPDAEIRAFAITRTISEPASFSEIEDPCVGSIRLHEEDTYRHP